MYIMHSCFLSHKYEQLSLETISKSIIAKVKSSFEPNMFKWVVKTNFIDSSLFALLIINVKIPSNFQNEWCTFGKRKGCLKKIKIVHF